MTEPITTWQMPRWCDRCMRTIRVEVTMQIPRPADGYLRRRWEDAARREAEASYHEEHVATVHGGTT